MCTVSRSHSLGQKGVTDQHIGLIVLHCEIQHLTCQVKLSKGIAEAQSVWVTGYGLVEIEYFGW